MSEEMQGMRLSEQAAAEFAQESAQERDARRRELEAIAARFTAPAELFEGGAFLMVIAFLSGLLFAYYAVFGQPPHVFYRVFMLVLGAWMVFFSVNSFLGRNKPVLTLTPTGLLLAGAQAEVPWEGIESIDYRALGFIVRTNTFLSFYLCGGVEPPTFARKRFRTRYFKRKNMLQVGTLGFRGIGEKDLSAMLEDAHNAGIARAALEEMR
jgi:hypothetical protein